MPRMVTMEDYRTIECPHVHWLLPGLLPHPSTLLLIGGPKVGKSTLALQLSLALAQQGEFLGIRPNRPYTVLYVQQDEPEASWRFSKLDVLHAHGVRLDGPCLMVHPSDARRGLNILRTPDADYVRAAVEEAKPDIIVLDVLRELFAGDENDSAVMRDVIATIDVIVGHERTAILLHHIHKLNPMLPTPRPCDAARGSSYLTGRVDGIWMLHNSILTIQARYGDSVTTLKRLPSGLFARHVSA